MKSFSGKVLFLDRSDINTDEIIPAKYLTENSKEALQPFLLEDLELEGFTPGKDTDGKRVIITRSNFGCGSSREHAPWALEVNGINLVLAESYARIFRFANQPTQISTDFEIGTFIVTSPGQEEKVPFVISDFDRALVEAGGWVEYADSRY